MYKIAFAEFRNLNLDSIYTNLFDQRNVTESEHKIVWESWSEFHKKVSKFIKKREF